MKQYLLIVFICLFAGICLANPIAKLPSDTAMVIRWDGSHLAEGNKGWDHPEIQDACAMFKEMLQSMMARVPDNPLGGIGYDFEDYLDLMKTKITVAVPIPEKPSDMPLIIFEEGKEVESRIRSLFIKMGGYTGKSFKMNGVTGEVLSANYDKVYTALWNGHYILCLQSEASLKNFIQGQESAPSENFQSLSKMTDSGGSTLLSVYVDLQKVWATAPKSAAEDLENLGINNWQGLMLQLQKGDTNQAKLALLAPGKKEGLTEMLSLSGGDFQKLKNHLPFAVSQLNYIHLDFQKMMQQAMALAKKSDPREYERMEKNLENFRQTGWDLEKEILGVFNGDILFVSPDAKHASLRGSSYMLLGLRDSKQFRTSVDRLLSMGFVEKKEITHHGKTIEYYMTPLQDIMTRVMQGVDDFEPSPGSFAQLGLNYYLGLNLCFMVDGDILVTSGLVQNLKDYVDHRQENPDFTPKQPLASNQTGMISWGGSADSSLYTYNTLLPILSFLESAIREAGIPFKMSRMPSPGTLRPLFGPFHATWENHQDGIVMSFKGSGLNFSGGSLIAVAGVGVFAAFLIPAMSDVQKKSKEINAISSLRTLSSAQSIFQVSAYIDEDEDGIGEYGFLQELTLQSKARLSYDPGVAYLAEAYYVNEMGIAEHNGYCFKVYLPSKDGGIGESFPLSDLSQDEDDINRRESGFIIYAWPQEYGSTGVEVFVINQSGEVFVSPNEQMYSGYDNIPTGSAALNKDDEGFATLEAPFADFDNAGDGGEWYPR